MKIITLLFTILMVACAKNSGSIIVQSTPSLENRIHRFLAEYDSALYVVEKEYNDQNPKSLRDTCKLTSSPDYIASIVFYENCPTYDSLSSRYFRKLKIVHKEYWDSTELKNRSLGLGSPAEKRETQAKKIFTCEDSTIRVLARSGFVNRNYDDDVMVMKMVNDKLRIFHSNSIRGYSGLDPFRGCKLVTKE